MPLNKCLTFAEGPDTKKPGEELKAEKERSALRRKADINLVDVSQLVDLPKLLEHRIVVECVALLISNGTYRKNAQEQARLEALHLPSLYNL